LRIWHISPEYINHNWTEELLLLMFDKLNENMRRAHAVVSPDSRGNYKQVTDRELFASMGVIVQRV
jgi:hypothetical protein